MHTRFTFTILFCLLSAKCGGTITDLNGEIRIQQSNLQSKKMDCFWHIDVPDDHYITLRFLEFDLGSGEDCIHNNYLNLTEVYEANINGTIYSALLYVYYTNGNLIAFRD